MASVEKRGARWRVRWRDPQGRNRSKAFDRKIDADRWLIRVSHELLAGTYVDPAAGKETVASFSERWRKMKLHSSGTAAQVESHMRLHVLPVIGSMPLARVRPSDVQLVVNTAADKLKASTVATMYTHMSSMFKAAVRDRLIVVSPCIDIDLPKNHGRPLQLLTREHVAAAAANITRTYRAAVVLGAGAGLRPSEALGVSTDRVDWLDGMVTVDRQLVKGKLERPKTASSVRDVPIPTAVVKALEAHLAGEGRTEGPLSVSRAGGPPSRNRYADAWRRVRNAGLVPDWSTPHDLRHYYASALIRRGLDVKTVQARLGHRSATTTLDIYGHLWGDHEDRTRVAIEGELAGVFGEDSCPGGVPDQPV